MKAYSWNFLARWHWCFHTQCVVTSNHMHAVCASCLYSSNSLAKLFSLRANKVNLSSLSVQKTHDNVNNLNVIVILIMNFIESALLHNHTFIHLATGKVLCSDNNNQLYQTLKSDNDIINKIPIPSSPDFRGSGLLAPKKKLRKNPTPFEFK